MQFILQNIKTWPLTCYNFQPLYMLWNYHIYRASYSTVNSIYYIHYRHCMLYLHVPHIKHHCMNYKWTITFRGLSHYKVQFSNMPSFIYTCHVCLKWRIACLTNIIHSHMFFWTWFISSWSNFTIFLWCEVVMTLMFSKVYFH